MRRLTNALQSVDTPAQQAHGALNVVARTPDLLSPGELWRRLGGSEANFYRLQKLGHFRHLEVSRPVGVRRYSRFKVEAFCNGESTVAFGKGARRHA
jgi:hypothetical protein